MDISILKLKKHTDPKGFLVEFLTEKDIKKNKVFGHLFFVNFKDKKAIRGNHYHEKQHEYYTAIIGKIKVILVDVETRERKTIILSGDGRDFRRLRIGPKIAHAAYSLTKNAVLLSYYKYPYDPKNPDTKEFKIIETR